MISHYDLVLLYDPQCKTSQKAYALLQALANQLVGYRIQVFDMTQPQQPLLKRPLILPTWIIHDKMTLVGLPTQCEILRHLQKD